MKKIIAILLIFTVLAIVGAEIGLRMIGVIDFPIYATDSSIGYIPRSSQSGSFLNKNDWVVNEKNMDVEESWKPNGDKDLLLIGDSIVWGGNPIHQPDKLGPQLQEILADWKIWPVSAGSWSVENPQVWMARHPEVMAEVDCVVWVVNSGDFAPASQWKSDMTHPRAKPKSALWFVVDKYVLPKLGLKKKAVESTGSENRLSKADALSWRDALIALEDREVRTITVLYPDKEEKLQPAAFDEFKAMAWRCWTQGWNRLNSSMNPIGRKSFIATQFTPHPLATRF